ncbi:MAG TPA: hypothetical protein VFQ23_07820 [Anaerolineales bacterium]|nr:hypothetical protein [Anaerolineales bacterium]
MPVSLTSLAVPRTELSESEIQSMFRVFSENFNGSTLDIFERDLHNKNWVILLRDGETKEIEGFSTLSLYETTFNHQRLSVVYSGDTIIRREYWGTPQLPSTWIKTVLEKSTNMIQPLYWLLISSGYKTYRFLTVFYKEFYPRYDAPTPPDVQALMEHLAGQRYGADYHCEDGVVRFQQGATPLREGIAEVTEERLHDPHVSFYIERNPGYVNGDELVCITRVHPDNFTPAGRRMAR